MRANGTARFFDQGSLPGWLSIPDGAQGEQATTLKFSRPWHLHAANEDVVEQRRDSLHRLR
jgi:hypothetical protein